MDLLFLRESNIDNIYLKTVLRAKIISSKILFFYRYGNQLKARFLNKFKIPLFVLYRNKFVKCNYYETNSYTYNNLFKMFADGDWITEVHCITSVKSKAKLLIPISYSSGLIEISCLPFVTKYIVPRIFIDTKLDNNLKFNFLSQISKKNVVLKIKYSSINIKQLKFLPITIDLAQSKNKNCKLSIISIKLIKTE